MKKIILLALGAFVFLMFQNCSQPENNASVKTGEASSHLFTLLSQKKTGIDFKNSVTDNEERNYFNFEYIYNGAGVAAGDINNDGLPDLFFAGNENGSRLYLNKGGFQFEDITEKAGVGSTGWHTGVNMIDINCDGLLDIFVCRAGWKNKMDKRNLLFINKGDLTFEESADKYGFKENDYSLQSSFFDYDKDGDLDVYVSNFPVAFHMPLPERLKKRVNPDENVRDKLYRNNGDNTFTELGRQAGIVNYAHGLGVVTTDINEDGYPDIYVSNDYNEQDFLYINNGDGTFTDRIKDFTGHTSFYGMGVDIADINNDGLEDIFETEMLPNDYKRSKTNMASMNVKKFEGLISLGVHYQYMHNSLQLNRGVGRFSEISQLAGVSKTDWSWACLLSDFDNDGWRDLFIANGYKRDVYDKDYKKEVSKAADKKGEKLSMDEVLQFIPSTKLSNFIFQNSKDLTFKDKTLDWGLDELTWSQGTTIADFDNDGDLDLAINNLDDRAMVYRNNAETLGNSYLKIKLEGSKGNTMGIGAKVSIKSNGIDQSLYFKTTRGYLSSVEPLVRFGTGSAQVIDEVKIQWPDGKQNILNNVPANQLLKITYENAAEGDNSPAAKKTLFKDMTNQVLDKVFVHRDIKFDDYHKQILLPHKLSQLGPFISTGDVNNDGLEDFFIGGARGFAGQLYIQKRGGKFTAKKTAAFEKDMAHEDMGSLFFDADNDGDLDLYIVSGGVEVPAKLNDYYQDRLYLNNGKGGFSKSNGLPQILASGSCVAAADYDKDGDLDLLVGGRVFPDHYPYPTQTYLMRNDGGTFTDVAGQVAPQLQMAGMVTSALWTDLNQDGWIDLVLAGEWMPIRFYLNQNGKLADATAQFLPEETTGWWNSLHLMDFDNDGDQDIIAGNLGLNHKFHASSDKPFHIYCKDFDQNGSMDIVLAKYADDKQVPVRGKQCSSEQMPFVSQNFSTYTAFADASVGDIYGGKGLADALHHEAKMFQSVVLVNENGRFSTMPLPQEAQFAPINGIATGDFNSDGKEEIVVAGNMYHTEVETTRADASLGLLFGLGQEGNWTVVEPRESGLNLYKDVKDIKVISIGKKGKKALIVANNDSSIGVLMAQIVVR